MKSKMFLFLVFLSLIVLPIFADEKEQALQQAVTNTAEVVSSDSAQPSSGQSTNARNWLPSVESNTALGIGAVAALGGLVAYKFYGIYSSGSFNWMSRLVCRNKYKKLEKLQSEINLCTFAALRLNDPDDYRTPKDIFDKTEKFLRIIAADRQGIHNISNLRDHDFTTALETIEKELKTLNAKFNELKEIANEISVLERHNKVFLPEMDLKRIESIEKQFFADLYEDDFYSRYALAKRLAFGVWKGIKRLEAMQLIVKRLKERSQATASSRAS